MLKVVALKHCTKLDSILFKEIVSFLDRCEQEKIQKFYKWQDAERSLLGNLMIRATICDLFQVNNTDVKIARNQMGKPYIYNMPQAHFNISHSGEWIVGAFDSLPVGVDIEQIKALDLNMAKSILAVGDSIEMMKMKDSDCLNHFYSCWTLGESYLKMLGSGVTLPLPSTIKLYDKAFFKNYSIDEEYILSICSNHGLFPEGIVFNDIEQLLNLVGK